MTSQSEHAPDGMYPRFEKNSAGSRLSRRDLLKLASAGVVAVTAGLLADGNHPSPKNIIDVAKEGSAKAQEFIDFSERNLSVIEEDDGAEKYLLSVLQQKIDEEKAGGVATLDEKALRRLLDDSRSEVAALAAYVLCYDYEDALDKDPQLVDKIAAIFIPHALYRVEEMKPVGETFGEVIQTLRFKTSRAIRPLSDTLADKLGKGSKRGLLMISVQSDREYAESHARFLGVIGLGFVATTKNRGIEALDMLAKKRGIAELAKIAKTDALSAEMVRGNASIRQSDGE